MAIMSRMVAEKNKMLQATITERGLCTINKKGEEFDQFYEKWAVENGITYEVKKTTLKMNWNDVQLGRKVGMDMPLPVVNPVVK